MIKNKATVVILFFCAVKLILHLIADAHSGFQGDELLHIETGRHPAFGYMEFPPMIGWLAYMQDQLHSQSVFVHHIFSHLAALLIIVLVGLTTIELGGKTKAVFFALLCIIIAPCFGRGQQLFQPVVFSQLFWLLSFYLLVCFVKTLDQKYLLYLSLSLVFGFLSKYDICFFIAGLSSLLLFKRTREAVVTQSLWKYIVLFLALISPNLWWEYHHQFPVFNMFSRLYQMQLGKLTVSGVVTELIISLNPLTAVLWIAGFVYMLRKTDTGWLRPVAGSILISLLLFALTKSKAYYFYPAMISLEIFGSIWLEQKILVRRPWIIYPATALLLASGIFLIPFGLAILPGDTFIKFAHIKEEDDHYQMTLDCQEYFSQIKWRNTLMALQQVYDSLPPPERRTCLIWGKHYSQAGGVNLMGKSYGLPPAFSYHGSFYLWAPSGAMPTIIAFTNDEAPIGFFQDFFNTVVPVKRVFNRYAMFDKDLWQTIYICKDPKQNFEALKKDFALRIFE